ncbi:ABC transporter permease [Caldifermentibacillus hisashii]|uniref:ABC transporter permease n=1 Tax=Caldifermentibacillus hisashii TaxID=996558 RepID=UPI001C10C6A4|nr:ABC transporter permease [Caldifermentibacillus hisashii]MBU5342126.1 ABC transporter permease [Caldifermentibacillus hisashii]
MVKTNDNKILKYVSATWSGYSFIFIFFIIFLIYYISNGGITWNGVMNILRHTSVIGIIALGMGIVVITGEIDLSVGSTLALVGGYSVIIFNMTDSIIVTLIFAIVFGLICGLLNGVLVGVTKIPSFIVTLATMLIFRSLSQYSCKILNPELTGGTNSVYKIINTLSSFDLFYKFGNGILFTIPVTGIFLILVTVLFIYISTRTKFGKKLYAVGSNAGAARLSGIQVNLFRVIVFGLSGAMVGLAAFLWIAMNASIDPATTGKSYEMYAIAAVVIGGISMSGGRGKCIGILFGAMSYTVIDKIIVALAVDSLINDTIKGVILIVAMLMQTLSPIIKEKMKVRKLKEL